MATSVTEFLKYVETGIGTNIPSLRNLAVDQDRIRPVGEYLDFL